MRFITDAEKETLTAYTDEMTACYKTVKHLAVSMECFHKKAQDPDKQPELDAAEARFDELHTLHSTLMSQVKYRYSNQLQEDVSLFEAAYTTVLGAITCKDYMTYMQPFIASASVSKEEYEKEFELPAEKTRDGKPAMLHYVYPPQWMQQYSRQTALYYLTRIVLSYEYASFLIKYSDIIDKSDDKIDLFPPVFTAEVSTDAQQFLDAVDAKAKKLAQQAKAADKHKQQAAMRSAGLQFFAEKEAPAAVQLSLFDNEKFTSMLQAPPINDLITASTSDMEVDPVTGTASTQSNNSIIAFEHYDELIHKYNTSTSKLVCAALIQLTKQLHIDDLQSGTLNTTVCFSLRDYARDCGMHVDPRQYDAPEDNAKEQQRVRENLKKFKRDVAADIKTASSASVTNTDRSSGDFSLYRIVSSGGVKGDVVRINFDADAARSLLRQGYIMKYSRALMSIPNNKPNAYSIGYKLQLTYGMDRNYTRGTNDKQSIPAIIKSSANIPTWEELQASGDRHWKEKIKQRIEDALDTQLDYNVLQQWEYVDAKDNRYTRMDADNMTVDEYMRLYIAFTVKDFPEQERVERITKKEQEAAEQAAQRKRRSRKKTTSTTDKQ